MYHLNCPKGCDGEKTLEENRISWAEALHIAGGNADRALVHARWSPEDGYVLVPDLSCACPLTDEEFDKLQEECDLTYFEGD